MIRAAVSGALVATLIALTPVQAWCGGGIFRRSSCFRGHCVQKAAIVEQVVVDPIYQQPAAPIVIQNNYPPAANLGSTIYGYEAQQYGYNPFQVDPGEILREAARLTEASQKLTQEGLGVYQALGQDALAHAALSDQLRARAELIKATEPANLVQQYRLQQQQVQALQSSQTIILKPDGKGGYTVSLASDATDSAVDTQPVSQGSSVLSAKCAQCHTGGESKGGFTMFSPEGSLVELTDIQKTKIVSLASNGLMPPPPTAQLSDGELQAVVQLLSQ